MPESFDGMLAELADAAASATALPDVAAVRRRARERTVHRRLAASAVALTFLAACGGTIAAAALRQAPAAKAGALGTPAASRSVASPGQSPGHSPGHSAGQSPNPSATASPGALGTGVAQGVPAAGPYAAAVGLWQVDGGVRELIVYPDGVFGIGQAGQWSFCEGRLKPSGAADFAVPVVACSDYGVNMMSLHVQAGGKELTLSAATLLKSKTAPVSYHRLAYTPGGAVKGSLAALVRLAGAWSSGTGDQRHIQLTGDGGVRFSEINNTGASITYTGQITGYYADGVRVESPCPDPSADGQADCMVMQLQYDGGGLMTAIGSYGTEVFTLDGASGSSSLFSFGPSA